MKIDNVLELKHFLEKQEEKWYSDTKRVELFGEFDLNPVLVPTWDNEGYFTGFVRANIQLDPELGLILEPQEEYEV